jgi:hypothetical protein
MTGSCQRADTEPYFKYCPSYTTRNKADDTQEPHADPLPKVCEVTRMLPAHGREWPGRGLRASCTIGNDRRELPVPSTNPAGCL